MSYTAPSIDASGLHIPTYTEIRDDLTETAKKIFGQDIYLGTDSMDYQFISAVALKINDTLQLLQLVYNNRSPVTAVGSALDAIVKLNGIARKAASYSMCEVTLAGTADTVITNGVVTDASSNNWDLPDTVIIGSDGYVTVTAICQTIGAVSAAVGDIITITTPTKGWTSVTNTVAAVIGQAVELDSALRARQAVSTELSSKTLLDGTIAGIAAVSGVTRYHVYENDTNSYDSNSLPPHSITSVVEGGTDDGVANAIYLNKGLGCYTNGATVVEVANLYGITTPIRFYRPTYISIYATINIKLLSGGTSATLTLIKSAIVDYLNSLQIGENLTYSSIYGAALSTMSSLSSPIFSIRGIAIGTSASTLSTTDIDILFNQVTTTITDNIIVKQVTV